MASRICFILTCLIVFAGCYTQLRAPRVQQKQRAESPVSPSENSVQRFEYYYHNYCNPSEWRPLRFYGSYNPYRPYSSYRRYPVWNRHRLIWKYSCWATVYDPWWRGWSPRILVPHIVYAPAVRPRIETDWNEKPNLRPPSGTRAYVAHPPRPAQFGVAAPKQRAPPQHSRRETRAAPKHNHQKNLKKKKKNLKSAKKNAQHSVAEGK